MTEIVGPGIQPRMIEAELNYCGPMDYKPQLFLRRKHLAEGEGARDDGKESDTDQTARVMNIEPHRISVLDASSVDYDPDLDREGFVLVHHPSQVSDFRDKAQVRSIHFDEMRRLLRELTGADRIEFPYSDGTYRSSDPGAPQGPALYPHIDFSRTGAVEITDNVFPDRPREVRRWAVYNLWRVLSPEAPVDMPLAMLDAQSVKPEDLVPVDRSYDNDLGKSETLFLNFNPDHRWVYFSQMKRDDLLIFKTYDSDLNSYFPPAHVAIAETAAGTHPRMSFELRAYTCWYH